MRSLMRDDIIYFGKGHPDVDVLFNINEMTRETTIRMKSKESGKLIERVCTDLGPYIYMLLEDMYRKLKEGL